MRAIRDSSLSERDLTSTRDENLTLPGRGVVSPDEQDEQLRLLGGVHCTLIGSNIGSP